MRQPRISTKSRIYTAAWFWLVGKDTLEISKTMGWPEHEVYRHLTSIRSWSKRLQRQSA